MASLFTFSALDRRPYKKARAKLDRVVLRWALRQTALLAVALLAITLAPERPPAWLLALVYSTSFTALFVWLWPERQARSRLKRLARRAARIDDRRRAEGYVVMRVH